MLLVRLLDGLPFRSMYLKLILGSAIVALLVSLGVVFAMQMMGMDINPAIPAALAAIAAALFAARMAGGSHPANHGK